MPTQVRLRPHESTLIMLNPHNPLRPIQPSGSIRGEHSLILQIWHGDVNRLRRRRLEPQLPVPRHILNSQQCAICQNNHVQVAIADKDAVGGFDDLREDFLDGVGRSVTFALFGAAFADDDWVDGAFGPVDVFGGVHGALDVGAVEVGVGTGGGVDELSGEAQDIPEYWARNSISYLPRKQLKQINNNSPLLVNLVDIKAWVGFESQCIDQVEDITICLTGVVEVHWWLNTGCWELKVFLTVGSISA